MNKLTPKQALILLEIEGGAILHSPNFIGTVTGILTQASAAWEARSARAQRITQEQERVLSLLLVGLYMPDAGPIPDVVFVHRSTVEARLASGWTKAHCTDRDMERTA